MGVEIATTTHGDGVTFPKTGQTVTAHYVGALPQTRRDPSDVRVRSLLSRAVAPPRGVSSSDRRDLVSRLLRLSSLPPFLHPRPAAGCLTDGSEFDSSRKRGRPFQFTIGVGQVIRGWDEGMMQMSVGEKATLTCTPDYGYGPNGMPPVIPPNSTLVFDVELISVQ
jgi:FK506-binding protein 1|tara:strand:+ start:761 stop:1258 length:498 start_codon:yes stop_codon:yes gene_type:complete